VSSVLNARSKGPLTIDDLVHDLKWNGTEESDEDCDGAHTQRFSVLEPAENWSTSESVTRPWREIRGLVETQVQERRERHRQRKPAAGKAQQEEAWLVEEEDQEKKDDDRAAETVDALPYSVHDEIEYKLKGVTSRPRNGRVVVPNEVHMVYQAWDLNKWCNNLRGQHPGMLPQIGQITQFQRFEIARDTQCSSPRNVHITVSQSPLDEQDKKECQEESHRS